jgi:hypothetical protein
MLIATPWGHPRSSLGVGETNVSRLNLRPCPVNNKSLHTNGIFKFTTLLALPAPGTWPPTIESQQYSRWFLRGRWHAFQPSNWKSGSGKRLPPRPDPPMSAWDGMESSRVHPAELEAPPPSRYFIGSGDRPPKHWILIGWFGRHSAFFPGRAPSVATPITSGRSAACKRRRNHHLERRRSAVVGAAMVLSSPAEPTDPRWSRPWRWGAGGAGQALPASPVRPGHSERLSLSLSGYPASPSGTSAEAGVGVAWSGGLWGGDQRGAERLGFRSLLSSRSASRRRAREDGGEDGGEAGAPRAHASWAPLRQALCVSSGAGSRTGALASALHVFAHRVPSASPSPWTNPYVGISCDWRKKKDWWREWRGQGRADRSEIPWGVAPAFQELEGFPSGTVT